MSSHPRLVASFLAMASFTFFGCEGAPGIALTDAGTRDDGAATDGGPRPDAFSDHDAAQECHTDADCEDGDPTTHAYCHPLFGACVATECIEDAECDDGDPCTLDYCLSRSNC